MRAGLAHTAADLGVGFRTEGHPTAFWSVFDDMEPAASVEKAEQLGRLLLDERVITYHHTWLPSAAHDDEAFDFTMAAFRRALRRL